VIGAAYTPETKQLHSYALTIVNDTYYGLKTLGQTQYDGDVSRIDIVALKAQGGQKIMIYDSVDNELKSFSMDLKK
jgi:hypothetical protein